MVGLGRFELPTSPLSGVRSNQLSYRPSAQKQTIRVRTTRLNFAGPNLSIAFAHNIGLFFFKEVIQPQVPLRLPCYDFTPVMNHTVVTVFPKVRLITSGAIHFHGVTGGVYKARERIHRDILIREY